MVGNYCAEWGGVSAVMRNLTTGLRSDGHLVDILSTNGGMSGRALAMVRLVFRARNYDVLHVHGSSYIGIVTPYIVTLIGNLLHRPVVVTYHGWPRFAKAFTPTSHMVDAITRRAAIVTTPIEASAECFRKNGMRAVGIPNPLVVSAWPFKKRPKIGPRLVSTKTSLNPAVSVGALKAIREKFPHATLDMCSYGATLEKLPQYTDVAGLTLHGFIPRYDLAKVLDRCDIYLNTVEDDSFGYRHFEAMAAGLAIVSVPNEALATYAGPEIVTFADTTPEAFADAIMEVLDNPEATQKRIERGRAKVKEFTWEQLSPVWKDVYTYAMDRTGRLRNHRLSVCLNVLGWLIAAPIAYMVWLVYAPAYLWFRLMSQK